MIREQGAAITDGSGKIIGMTGTFYNRLIPRSGDIGTTPDCVPISSAMELLSPDAADRPWAGGPAVTALVTDNRGTSILGHILPSVSAYGKMTEAVQELLGTLGKPLDDTDALAEHYAVFRHPCPVDGILLTLTYPNLQELRNTEGELLDQAKWVGLEWARSEGKPNRLFYGTKPYDIEGIYQLNGAMTHLEECLNLDLGME